MFGPSSLGIGLNWKERTPKDKKVPTAPTTRGDDEPGACTAPFEWPRLRTEEAKAHLPTGGGAGLSWRSHPPGVETAERPIWGLFICESDFYTSATPFNLPAAPEATER
jgi:hypothetical protein